jgi:hypothetical protein
VNVTLWLQTRKSTGLYPHRMSATVTGDSDREALDLRVRVSQRARKEAARIRLQTEHRRLRDVVARHEQVMVFTSTIEECISSSGRVIPLRRRSPMASAKYIRKLQVGYLVFIQSLPSNSSFRGCFTRSFSFRGNTRRGLYLLSYMQLLIRQSAEGFVMNLDDDERSTLS